jgi:hypothetical protein
LQLVAKQRRLRAPLSFLLSTYAIHAKNSYSISKSIRSLSTSPCRVLTLSAARFRDRIDLEMELVRLCMVAHGMLNLAKAECLWRSDQSAVFSGDVQEIPHEQS